VATPGVFARQVSDVPMGEWPSAVGWAESMGATGLEPVTFRA
jgi:hypothetical protein